MQKEEIVQAVRDYVNNDKATYAVLINGVWGSGKTYFYKHCLKDEIAKIENGSNNRKANVYISLYGISSAEQLSKEIITSYLIEAKLRGDKSKEKIYKQMKKTIGIINKMFSFSINCLSIDFDKGIKKIRKNIEFKDMVVCLDDFERCNVPINELFGMINSLVEHCNCKVIILADEDNIGKMYANTNIEEKYLTILMGRSLIIKREDKKNNNVSKNNSENADDFTVEELKKLNEELYSGNYIYKDIKEKIIGLSLKYTPNLRNEFKSIISDTVKSPELAKKLEQESGRILEYMDKCRNSNIRIMKIWLINFERIYKVISKYFSNNQYNKYFDEIFDRFAVYTIRVACALGKNKHLENWADGVEVGYITLEDDFFVKCQGFRFVDDLFKDSIFDDHRICHAAKVIIQEKIDEEEFKKDSLRRRAYEKLSQWYYLEDEEISQNLSALKEEIENDDFKPQNYQSIIYMLVILMQEKYVGEKFIEEISNILEKKLNNIEGKIDTENFRYDFSLQESLDLFHQYYDPIYSIIMEKNRKTEKQEINQDYSNGEEFLSYCLDNYDKFIVNKTFISNIDLDRLMDIIQKKNIKGIYDVARGFEKVYYSSNFYEFYADDISMLKNLVKRLTELNFMSVSRTRKKAIDNLCGTLNKKISIIEKNGQNFING